jgi:hypothetical protein
LRTACGDAAPGGQIVNIIILIILHQQQMVEYPAASTVDNIQNNTMQKQSGVQIL